MFLRGLGAEDTVRGGGATAKLRVDGSTLVPAQPARLGTAVSQRGNVHGRSQWRFAWTSWKRCDKEQ